MRRGLLALGEDGVQHFPVLAEAHAQWVAQAGERQQIMQLCWLAFRV